jgi:uncharacterized SAM-binding protein YcdF (DUF218 family)
MILMSFGLSYAWVLFRIVRLGRNASTVAHTQDVLILGKELQNGRADDEFRRRLNRGAELYLHQGIQRLILLGGRTSEDGPSEAEAGRDLLLSLGIPDSVIVLEERSRHTLENLRNARDVLKKGYQKRIGLISSRYHLARSQSMAKELGLRVELIAAEAETNFSKPGALFLEAYLYHWYLVGHFMAHRMNDQSSIDQIS